MKSERRQLLRSHYQKIRNELSATTLATSSARICEKMCTMQDYQEAQHVAIYHAVSGEVDLGVLLKDGRKTYYFPIMNANNTLSFLPVTATTSFYTNQFGIAEPNVQITLAIELDQLDIICLPLVAFDEYGNRLGMGGGYYDRTLAQHHNALLIGVGHEFQRTSSLPTQPWDIPLDIIITEHNIYRSKPCPIIG